MALGNRLIKYSVVLIPTIRIAKFTICLSIGVAAGPAGQVLAGPLLSKVKMKLHFCKKQAINRSASMIFRLVRLIILLYNR